MAVSLGLRFQRPDAHRAVKGSGDEGFAIGSERQAQDRRLMAGENAGEAFVERPEGRIGLMRGNEPIARGSEGEKVL